MPAKKKESQPRQTATPKPAEPNYQSVRERADAWLVDRADRLESLLDQEDLSREDQLKIFDGQEALVHLRSKGHECSQQIQKLKKLWRSLEQGAFDSSGALAKVPVEFPVTHLSTGDLRDFWLTSDEVPEDEEIPPDDFLLDATMLRTADWCDIKEFDEWWERLTNWDSRRVFLNPPPNEFPRYEWLFRMVRSEWARDRALSVLEQTLKTVEARSADGQPWEVWRATELAAEYPAHVAAAWVGHSTAVASKHYWRVRDEDFQRAIAGDAKSGAHSVAQKAAQATSAITGHHASGQETSQETEASCGVLTKDSQTWKTRQVTPTGLEPVLPP